MRSYFKKNETDELVNQTQTKVNEAIDEFISIDDTEPSSPTYTDRKVHVQVLEQDVVGSLNDYIYTNIGIEENDRKLTVSWCEPTSVIDKSASQWVGTKLVYKKNSYPENPSDGHLAVYNTKRNQYRNGLDINNLDNGDTYYFRFFPIDEDGNFYINDENKISGTPGVKDEEKPHANTSLKTVTNLIARPDYNKIKLSWRDPSDVVIDGVTVTSWVGTKVVYKEDSYPTSPEDGTLLVDNTTRDQFTEEEPIVIDNLRRGVRYYIALYPYDNKGNIGNDNVSRVNKVPKYARLTNITNIETTPSNGTVRIRWKDPDDTVVDDEVVTRWMATKIVYKEGSYPNDPEDGLLAIDNRERNRYQSEGYNIHGLTNGTTYFFTLFPLDTDGYVDKYSLGYVSDTPVYSELSTVSNLVVEPSTKSVRVFWKDPNDVVDGNRTITQWGKTVLVYKEDSYPESISDGVIAVENRTRDKYTTLGFNVTGLTNGTTYYFSVFVFDNVGRLAESSISRFTAKPETIPVGSVSNVVITPTDQSILLKYTDPDDIVHENEVLNRWAKTKIVFKTGSYPITSNDGTIFESVTKNEYKQTPLVINNLTNGTEYFLSIYTFDEDGVCDENAIYKTTFTPVPGVLSPISNVSAVAGDSSISLKWTDPNDIVTDGIVTTKWNKTIVVYKTTGYPSDPNDGTVIIDSRTRNEYRTNPFIIPNLINGTTYFFRFFAYDTADNYDGVNAVTVQATPVEYIAPPTRLDLGPISNLEVHNDDGYSWLRWNNPSRTVTSEVGVTSTWTKAVVVYKEGTTYPTNVNDGKIAYTLDEYKTQDAAYITGIKNGTTYAVRIFIYDDEGYTMLYDANIALIKPVAEFSSALKIYSFSITSDPDRYKFIEYTGDTVGKTPMNITGMAATDNDAKPERITNGSWTNEWFFPRPVMLRYDGTVAYYLDPNDPSKKVDGSPSDIGNVAFKGNAMMEWGRSDLKIWYKILPASSDATTANIYIANKQVDSSYNAWSFYDCNNVLKDHFYTAMFLGSVHDGVLRSLASKTPVYGQTGIKELEYVRWNNSLGGKTGDHWYTDTYCDRILINILLLMIGKCTDTQRVFGYGIEGQTNPSDTGHATKMFYGTKGGNDHVVVFGMHDYWGNLCRRMAGHITTGTGIQKYKLTPGSKDGGGTGYNVNGSGYLTGSVANPGGTKETKGYVSKLHFRTNGSYVFKEVKGSSSSYWCDWAIWGNSGYAYVGGHYKIGNEHEPGAFYIGTGAPFSNGYNTIGVALTYR